jgi:hypothetical protein
VLLPSLAAAFLAAASRRFPLPAPFASVYVKLKAITDGSTPVGVIIVGHRLFYARLTV